MGWHKNWREQALWYEKQLKVAHRRLERLEKILGMRAIYDVPGFTRTESLILTMIYTQKMAHRSSLYHRLYGMGQVTDKQRKTIDTLLCYIRRKLKTHNIEIKTRHQFGWYMEEASKSRLRCLIRFGFIPNVIAQERAFSQN